MKILHIKVSHDLNNSASRKLSHHLVEKLKKEYNGVVEEILDLSENPIPHLSALTISSFFTPVENRSVDQHDSIKLSDTLVDQLFDNDVIVISTPMWNLGLPSVLKAWFDHVTRAGRTFAFTNEGTKVGLVHNKKVYIIISSGSIFSEGVFMADDQCSPYFRAALAYIGITNVEIIRVEGTHTPSTTATAMPRAIKQINNMKLS